MRVAGVVAAAVALSAPYWLPNRVVALRGKVFARVNGDRARTFPDDVVGADRFEELYSHPAANGRSRGADLSDLFWYWLSPGPEVHQEHLEAGPRYDDVARCTLRILAGPGAELSEAAARRTAAVLDELVTGRATLVRSRDLMMPVWAEFFHELVFREPCPPEAACGPLGAIVAGALVAQGETEEALVLDSELLVEGAGCRMSFLLLPCGEGVGGLLARLGV